MKGLRSALCCAAAIGAGAAAGADRLTVTEIASGIYVHAGAQAETSAANRGDIANIGFIVGARCVAVIDTGGSPAVGRALREALRDVTPLPICYVINTHVHPDHIFGNVAFKVDKAEFVGHARLAAAMSARGRVYLAGLERTLGSGAAGAEIIPPTRTVTGTLALDLGQRTLRLRAWPTAHTDNDLTVFDESTATMWLADLLFIERIPVIDGSLPGWLAVLAELRGVAAKRIVPGHGGVTGDWPAASAPEEHYLQQLLVETRAALRARRTLQEAVDTVGSGERGNWLLFDQYHRRNVTAAFAELEWEE